MYFSGSDITISVHVKLNRASSLDSDTYTRIFEVDAAFFQFQVSQSKMPIYGYKSKNFDIVADGEELIQGQFIINFKAPNSVPFLSNGEKIEQIDIDYTNQNEKIKVRGANKYAGYILHDIHIQNMGQSITAGSEPTGETYTFFARKISYVYHSPTVDIEGDEPDMAKDVEIEEDRLLDTLPPVELLPYEKVIQDPYPEELSTIFYYKVRVFPLIATTVQDPPKWQIVRNLLALKAVADTVVTPDEPDPVFAYTQNVNMCVYSMSGSIPRLGATPIELPETKYFSKLMVGDTDKDAESSFLILKFESSRIPNTLLPKNQGTHIVTVDNPSLSDPYYILNNLILPHLINGKLNSVNGIIEIELLDVSSPILVIESVKIQHTRFIRWTPVYSEQNSSVNNLIDFRNNPSRKLSCLLADWTVIEKVHGPYTELLNSNGDALKDSLKTQIFDIINSGLA